VLVYVQFLLLGLPIVLGRRDIGLLALSWLRFLLLGRLFKL
jgi:hypothetical protein